jgi:hemerythrin-like domain-containing protein
MTNPTTIIKEDHRYIENLFEDYETLEDKDIDQKQDLALRIVTELRKHANMEELILYPALKFEFDEELLKLLEEAYVEHSVAKNLMEEITQMYPEDHQFDAKVKVLKETISHHVKEEEEKLLPGMEQEMDETDLDALGLKLKEYKTEEGELPII